jgi:hypothetical protein
MAVKSMYRTLNEHIVDMLVHINWNIYFKNYSCTLLFKVPSIVDLEMDIFLNPNC